MGQVTQPPAPSTRHGGPERSPVRRPRVASHLCAASYGARVAIPSIARPLNRVVRSLARIDEPRFATAAPRGSVRRGCGLGLGPRLLRHLDAPAGAHAGDDLADAV